MDKAIWQRMERGMKRAGFKVAVRIHKNTKKQKQGEIVARMLFKYPNEHYEWKWYTDYNDYRVLFVKKREIPPANPNQKSALETPSNGECNLALVPHTDYEKRIMKRLRKQTKKGIETYGQTLEENTNKGINFRLDYLAEELMDGLQYVEWVRDLIDHHSDVLISAISDLLMASNKSIIDGKEIRRIARVLNGELRRLNGKK